MAGDWIKLEKATLDKPEVYAIAEQLKLDVDAVLGKLFRVWNWFDDHTRNGNARGVTGLLADRLTGTPGFGDAMKSNNWLVEEGGALQLPNFERHNGKSAKKRAVTKNRVEEHRIEKRSGNANGNDTRNAGSVTDGVTREEKRREELVLVPAKAGMSESKIPPCPQQEILALYHKILPECGRVKLWTPARAKTLQARWREDPKRQTLTWWEYLFTYVAGSDFLCGRAPPSPGHDRSFQVDFDWIVAPKNIVKIIEEKY